MTRRTNVAATVAAGLLISVAGAATSSAGTGRAAPVDDISVTVGASQLSAIRQAGERLRSAKQERNEVKALRADLARRAARNGETYLDGDTEAFALSPRVSMAVPRGLPVKSVSVRVEGDKIVADVESEDTSSTGLATPQGHGMARWASSSGTYVITISGAGTMESKWLKRRLNDDGSSRFDYVALRRTGLGQPKEISGVNYSVTGLYISSHATDGTKAYVVDRFDQSPSQDFTGNCSGSYDISVSVLGVSAGGAFADCDHYDIAWSATEPGYYRNYMTQGAVFNGGNRSVGFQIALKIKQGKPANFTHYQRLEMARFIYPADTCSSWDSNETCS